VAKAEQLLPKTMNYQINKALQKLRTKGAELKFEPKQEDFNVQLDPALLGRLVHDSGSSTSTPTEDDHVFGSDDDS